MSNEVVTIIKDKIKITKPYGHKVVNKNCEVCGLTLRDSKDLACIEEWKCCTDCKDMYAYHNKEKWFKGWRPKIKSK